MKKFIYILIVTLLALAITGCSDTKKDKNTAGTEITSSAEVATPTPGITQAVVTEVPPTVKPIVEGSVVDVKFKSEAIAKNAVGQSAEKTIYIYLPPSYNSSDKSYPVVYFLHGYGDSPFIFMQTYRSQFDKAFNNGAKEFILVALDGNTKEGGSFYTNSIASGNWEDYVVDELVTYMDKNYRTIVSTDSRGIAGYSMGGFGALNLSLKHPDVFCSTLVFCPGIFAENDLDAVLNTWSGAMDVKKTYAQAFSPNLKDKDNYGNIIQTSDIEAKNKVWQEWMNGFSNWDQKLADYLALNQPLKSIMITYSDMDGYDWIPRGCVDLMGQMKQNGINYSTDKFTGGHIVPSDAVEKYFVPFFGESLSY